MGGARAGRRSPWYTEGARGRPEVLLAVVRAGARVGTPSRLKVSAGWIPDHVRLAVDTMGRGLVVWEESTAVRRRVMMQAVRDGNRLVGVPRALSLAVRAYAPDVAVASDGFVVAWHEEQFPVTKTVVRSVAPVEGR